MSAPLGPVPTPAAVLEQVLSGTDGACRLLRAVLEVQGVTWHVTFDHAGRLVERYAFDGHAGRYAWFRSPRPTMPSAAPDAGDLDDRTRLGGDWPVGDPVLQR